MTKFLPHTLFVSLSVASLALFACANSASGAPEEGDSGLSFDQKVAYSIGANLGQQLAMDGAELDAEMVLKGLEAALAGDELLLTDQEIGQTLQEFQKQLMQKRQARMQEEGAKNLEAGNAFLAENAKRQGVVITDSGLQYEVIREGEGAKPSATDQVTVHYHGTTIDGTVFDSSVERGQPATFGLNQVIAGWTEGVQLMSPGSKYKLYVPAALAYGQAAPPGAKFGPNATLVFEVELLSVEE